MKFSILHGYTNLTWELGNEPNSLKHQLGFQNEPLSAREGFQAASKAFKSFPSISKIFTIWS